ncbi:uncharacterized protein B0H18DRAFT_1014739 [Fomitopsis serialis]|uniref:uncharacterized protein n=1 Tax=Fomitopsis serialis TaxID=139415 RepID=UPI0020084A7A|nr:uncharacterized protein B0H18DRAFT_1014739 [Neoantrodia serialis]KAH9923488.1 hypothetical protein B0H18DRAFT_1014739 [Neoantrodia serialis]
MTALSPRRVPKLHPDPPPSHGRPVQANVMAHPQAKRGRDPPVSRWKAMLRLLRVCGMQLCF